jgi:hypothetical protein
MLDLKQRGVIILLGGAAWPLAARAQHPKITVIGFRGAVDCRQTRAVGG